MSILFRDLCTDTAGTLLTAHTSDTGHTYAYAPFDTNDGTPKISGNNAIRADDGGTTGNDGFVQTNYTHATDDIEAIKVIWDVISLSHYVGILLDVGQNSGLVEAYKVNPNADGSIYCDRTSGGFTTINPSGSGALSLNGTSDGVLHGKTAGQQIEGYLTLEHLTGPTRTRIRFYDPDHVLQAEWIDTSPIPATRRTGIYNNSNLASDSVGYHITEWGIASDPEDFYPTESPATSYTLTAPGTAEGEVGNPSGNFTVTPNGTFTGTITPDDDADGGTFTPTSLTWSGTSEAQTFTYTPASSGTKSIGATDDGALTDPSDVSYLAFVAATGFSISGPSTGTVGVASTNFTVSPSPSGSRVVGTVVVTPNDGAATGTFTPTTLTWTDEVGGKTFTYTADAEGEVTISVTNDGGLSNPAGHSYTASEAAATSYTLTAPSPASGLVSVASGNFTLTPNGTYTGTITPSDSGGGGTFTPTSQTWASETGAKTFTYTPASAGVKTISASDDGGLTDPSSVTYTASDPATVGELNIEAPTGLTLTATIRSDGGLVYDAVSEDLITPVDTLDTYGIALGEVVDGYYAAAAPTLAAGLYTITYYNTATSQAIGFGTLDTRALGGLSGPQDTKLTDIYNKAINLPASPAAVGSAMTLASGAITAAVIATDAIDADALAANAVAEIQNGLATSAQAIEMLASLQNALVTVEAGGLTGTIEIYTPGTAQTVGNLLQTIPISRSATTEPFSFARVS